MMMHKSNICGVILSQNSYLCAMQKELSALRLSFAHQQATQVDTNNSSNHQVGVCFTLSQRQFILFYKLCIYFVSLAYRFNLVCAGAACDRVQQAE